MHWSLHKSICQAANKSGQGLLKVLRISRINNILPATRTHKSDSDLFVMDGSSKVSSTRLYTYSPATCALVAVIGKEHVFLQHLSGWNAQGNPFSGNERRLKQILAPNFQFVQGFIVPGSQLDNGLLWGCGPPILPELLWENLDSIEWKKKLKLLTMYSRTCV